MGLIFEELSITSGLSLEISGVCPGQVGFDIRGATPNGLVTLMSGEEGGSSVIGGGPCAGVRLPIGDPTGRRSVAADADGIARFIGEISKPAACAPTIVVVDRTTCAVSNPARMP